MSKKKANTSSVTGVIVLIALITVCIAAVIVSQHLSRSPDTGASVSAANPSSSGTDRESTSPSEKIHINLEEQPPIDLGNGLEITDGGSYTGLYMEDGSNDIVSGVQMIVVRNNSENDLQLGQITAVCDEETYRFTVTNLPAGTQAVLLELDRKAAPGKALSSAVLENPVAFPEPMGLHEDVIQVGGLDGMLNVKNISDADISGDIYIYYKYAAQDLFYGGITFRVCLEGGLAAGELRQIPAGHFAPDSCTILQVTYYE